MAARISVLQEPEGRRADCGFRVVDAAKLGHAEIEKLSEKEPLLITNAFRADPAVAEQEAFLRTFGHITLHTTNRTDLLAKTTTSPIFNDTTFASWGAGDPPYVFHWCHDDPRSGPLAKATFGLPELVRTRARKIFITAGAPSDGVALHQHTSTWVSVHAGEKIWATFPPGPPPVPPHKHHTVKAMRRAGATLCTQRAGDLITLPELVWHATFHQTPWTLAFGGQASARPAVLDAVLGVVPPEGDDDDAIAAAAEYGHTDVLAALLARGGRVVPDAEGSGPLHLAVIAGHAAAAEQLLNAGSDVNLPAPAIKGSYFTPLTLAAMGGHMAVADLLLRRGAVLAKQGMVVATHPAAELGHTALLARFLELGIKPDAWDTAQKQALHYAAKSGHVAATRLLLGAGAPVGPIDKEGATPADYASHAGYVDVLKELLAKSQCSGSVPMFAMVAVHNGHAEVTRALIDWAAWPAKALTELENIAESKGHQAVAKLLRKAKRSPARPGQVRCSAQQELF